MFQTTNQVYYNMLPGLKMQLPRPPHVSTSYEKAWSPFLGAYMAAAEKKGHSGQGRSGPVAPLLSGFRWSWRYGYDRHGCEWTLQCGAPKIAKLVNITLISLGLMVDISIVYGIINQLITGGAPPCRSINRTAIVKGKRESESHRFWTYPIFRQSHIGL